MKKPDIIKDSDQARKLLADKFLSDKLNYSDIISCAKQFNVSITKSALSNYLNGKSDSYGLTQSQVIFLLIKYGFDVSLKLRKTTKTDAEITALLNALFK